MQGFIRAVADQSHPLQTKLSLIITDFEPNGNKQGVPLSEAENILKTAVASPLKINFDGYDYAGHKGAIPIGPITSAFAAKDNGRDVIAGEAVIWNDIYEDIADHLKVAFAEGIGTSWEIYFKDSEQDDNGVQWLKGCIFAGTCVVDTPAYGPNRTRVLAIAEKLNERAEIVENNHMAELEQQQAAAGTDTEELRMDISQVLDVLGNMYSGLYQMLDETYDLEAQLVTNDMPSLAEQLGKLVSSITKRFDSLKQQATTAEQALAEFKADVERVNAEKVAAEKLELRKAELADVGIELTAERQQFFVDMADDTFTNYINDLKIVKGSSAKAEVKKPLPEPVTSNHTEEISTKELAAAIRGN
jgi:hypothetical protein